MHLHILGICGTFMGGIAAIAREAGHRVTGCDANVYPPMSTQLAAQGITLVEGWGADQLALDPDVFVIGNVVTRGNPLMEAILDAGRAYLSGPQWLAENVLRDKWVLAVAGTHGKTTTASMLAWILEHAGLEPGFLIGGVPLDFGVSARLGGGSFFVVEADEYDTAFFDKRSKFVHYRPRTLVMNNLEFDHADIFADLAQIQRQFHHLVRTVPGGGLIVAPRADAALAEVLAMGCWTPVEHVDLADGSTWGVSRLSGDGSRFTVVCEGREIGDVHWCQTGLHNVANALAALAAARHAGVPPDVGVTALSSFQGVKRRMELRGEANGVRVYDDFAHHPTAIRTTLHGLRRQVGDARIVAILEPRSNTMRLGVHKDQLPEALAEADRVVVYAPASLGWDAAAVFARMGETAVVHARTEDIVRQVVAVARAGDHVLVMSNGGFEGIHQRLLEALGGGSGAPTADRPVVVRPSV